MGWRNEQAGKVAAKVLIQWHGCLETQTDTWLLPLLACHRAICPRGAFRGEKHKPRSARQNFGKRIMGKCSFSALAKYPLSSPLTYSDQRVSRGVCLTVALETYIADLIQHEKCIEIRAT